MKLIVGLGNPGSTYEATRHNIGFDVVERFAAKYRLALDTHEKEAMTGRGRVAGQGLMVARPLTYMNLSGVAVEKLVRAYLETPSDLLVVYDDIDLPLGKIRVRERGSPGTHNGMRSIIQALGTENFPRLRFGIRGEGEIRDLAGYVLERFTDEERDVIEPSMTRALDALLLFARGDLRRAMNTFNRDPSPERKEENEPTNDSR